jgi:DNA-binding CsgD family transcriptional regulator
MLHNDIGSSAAARFSKRQLEVLRLVAHGHSNAEIALALAISPRTVRMHTDVLKAKLGVARRRQILGAYFQLTGADPVRLDDQTARPLAFGLPEVGLAEAS